MRISEIHLYQHDLPVLGDNYQMSSASLDRLDTTIVKVVTDTGLSGYGETCPVGPTYQAHHALGARAALAEMSPHLLGCNPLFIDLAHRTMNEALEGHSYAKAAIDIALWDILGKHHGCRVCDLLGGAYRESVPSYYAVNIGDPETVTRQVIDKQDAGYLRVQLKVGGRSAEEDIAVVRRVFEVKKPDVSILLDANRSWTTAHAIEVSNACRDLPFVLEQPCNSYDEIKQIRPQISHPIFLDEIVTDVLAVSRAIHDGVADGFGMKLTRVGGLTAMRTIRDFCAAARRPFSSDDSWGGDIIAAACVHLGATVTPSLCAGVWIAAPYIEHHYDQKNGPEVTGGWIKVPTGYGLGIEPDVSQWTLQVLYG